MPKGEEPQNDKAESDAREAGDTGRKSGHGQATRLIHTRGRRGSAPTVNPPIERGSTVLFPTRAALYGPKPTYGRMGHAVHTELKDVLCDLEGASHVSLTANGVSACALAIASLVSAGDHVLFSDGLYGPTRRFCERRLARMGVKAEAIPAESGSDFSAHVQEKTSLLVLEAPSSLTFEIPDLRAIMDLARSRGIRTIVDNTWSAGVFLKPLALGADVSVQALTKYAVGHADSFGGAAMTATPDIAARLSACADDWGQSLSPDDAYTALRGMRTLPARLAVHQASGLALAEWLAGRDEVHRVLHPARQDHPGHALWKRDFIGATGLFGVVLNPVSEAGLDAFLEAMRLFGMGFSWGGYESLLIPCDDQLKRMAGHWCAEKPGPLLRVHAGLEDPADLISDLETAFDAMAAAEAAPKACE